MNIEELKEKVHRIQGDYGNPTEILQEICADFLRYFRVEIKGWSICPTEVEAYCYCKGNPDMFVHRNILQRNRFGYLYVHRHPENKTDAGTPKGRAGIDVCLSDSNNMYFGMLIRSAHVSGHNKTFSVNGPYSLYRELKQGQRPDFFKELETVSALKQNEPRKGYIFYSSRIGLPEGRCDYYLNSNLRAVIAESLVGTSFKMKEKLFEGLKLSDEEKTLISKDVLGYTPSYLNKL